MVNNISSMSMLTAQAVGRMWRKWNTSLLPRVYVVDVVLKNGKISTTKPHISENEIPPKYKNRCVIKLLSIIQNYV